jgi:hypothetical protein
MGGKMYPSYAFEGLVELFTGAIPIKEAFDIEFLMNAFIPPLMAIVFAIPFGWILQAVLVVVWSAITGKRDAPISN